MKLSFLTTELLHWDRLEPKDAPEALVLTLFEDERPLRGAAGLCDWRLAGRLSRLLQKGRISGALHETTLYPPGPRLPFPRLLLFGLGRGDFNEATAYEASDRLARSLVGLSLRKIALVLPGRSTGRLSARRALELWLEVAPSAGLRPETEIVIVESPAGQKEAADLARR